MQRIENNFLRDQDQLSIQEKEDRMIKEALDQITGSIDNLTAKAIVAVQLRKAFGEGEIYLDFEDASGLKEEIETFLNENPRVKNFLY